MKWKLCICNKQIHRYDFLSFFIHNIAFSSEKAIFPESVDTIFLMQSSLILTAPTHSLQRIHWWINYRMLNFFTTKTMFYRFGRVFVSVAPPVCLIHYILLVHTWIPETVTSCLHLNPLLILVECVLEDMYAWSFHHQTSTRTAKKRKV